MKKCPFCAEEIQDAAIKCRFCGERLEESGRSQDYKQWYYSTWVLVTAFLLAGPLALPWLWLNPRYSRAKKITATGIALIATAVIILALILVFNNYLDVLFRPLSPELNQ